MPDHQVGRATINWAKRMQNNEQNAANLATYNSLSPTEFGQRVGADTLIAFCKWAALIVDCLCRKPVAQLLD